MMRLLCMAGRNATCMARHVLPGRGARVTPRATFRERHKLPAPGGRVRRRVTSRVHLRVCQVSPGTLP